MTAEAGNGVIILSGHIDVPEEDLPRVLAALPRHIELTLEEPGCSVFRVERDEQIITVFHVYEEFADRASFDAHQARIPGTEWHEASRRARRFYDVRETRIAD